MEQSNEQAHVEAESNEEELVEEVTDTNDEQDVESLRKELATLKAQKDHWKKKASAEPKSESTETSESTKSEPSFLDGVLLAKANIHEEDIERVLKFSKAEGISVKEALSNEDMKAILDRRAEARKVAEASNTATTKAGQAERTGETILKNANAKNMPDTEDLEAMWDAERGR